VSPPITPEDLDDLPDHTQQLEELDSRPEVDGILPRHLGNSDLGRFVPGFTLVSGRTVQFHCLDDSGGKFSFQKKYEFKAEADVEVWESLWTGKIAFNWPDHSKALAIRGYEIAYISRFSLGRPVPEIEDMEAWAEEHLTITDSPELPDCTHTRGPHEQVSRLPLRVSSCEDCGMPMHVEYQENTVGVWESFLKEPWWEFTESTVLNSDGFELVVKPADSPTTLTDVAIHLLSRAGHAEYEPFDHFLGDYNAVGILYEEDFVGYLLWNTVSSRVVLQTIYVRPAYRGQGLASQVLENWYSEVCPTETYYASEPNDGGFSVLNSVGHTGSDGPATPVRVHSAGDEVEGDYAPGQDRWKQD